MPTHTTTLSKSHFYARSFSLICLSLDRTPAGPWLGLHYADIGCFVAPKRRQLVDRPVLVPGSVILFGRRRPDAFARFARQWISGGRYHGCACLSAWGCWGGRLV